MARPAMTCSLLAFGAGLALLGIYAFVASRENFFLQPDFNYGSAVATYLYTLHPSQAGSFLWKIVLLLPATVLLAWATARQGALPSLDRILRFRRLPLLLGIAALVGLTATAGLIFRWTEVTDDENAYRFQEETYLAGRLYNPPPPTQANFENTFIINDGALYAGKYPAGHPLLLALGTILGHEYALTLLMSAGLVLIVAAIARRLYGDGPVRNLAALLVAISPLFYLVSSSRLSHMSSAFFLGIFFLIFLELRREERRSLLRSAVLAFVAGLAAGIAANMRPLTAIAFLFPFLILIAIRFLRKESREVLPVAFMAVGFLVVILGTLWYNHAITGSFLVFPGNYYSHQDDLGFGQTGHTLARGIANLGTNIVRLNAFLFGFPLSLLFVGFLLLRGRPERSDRLLLAIAGCFAVAYLFYWSPGVGDLGPVYYYETLIPLALLSGRGILLLHETVRTHWPSKGGFAANFLLLSTALSLVTFYPERLMHVRRLTDAIRKPYEVMRESGAHNAVVFIVSEANEGWVFGHRTNSPSLTDDLVLCRLADPASNERTVDSFPGRSLYVLLPYGTPRRYEFRKVDRRELLATNWIALLIERERAVAARH